MKGEIPFTDLNNNNSGIPERETIDPSMFEVEEVGYLTDNCENVFDTIIETEEDARVQTVENDRSHISRFPIDNAYIDLNESNIIENRLRIRR